MTTFTGYLALGNGTTTFTEEAGTGYARQAITLSNLSSNRTSNTAAQTFTASGTNWTAVTQYALFATSTGGSPLIWWLKVIPVTVANTTSMIVGAASLQLLFSSSFYKAGAITLWSVGDVIGYDNANQALTVGYPLSASDGVIRSNNSIPGFGSKIGQILSANMNVTTDQRFVQLGFGGSFIIRKIVAANASISLTTAAGGFYTTTSKGGTPIVAATQAYSGLTGLTLYLDITLASVDRKSTRLNSSHRC